MACMGHMYWVIIDTNYSVFKNPIFVRGGGRFVQYISMPVVLIKGKCPHFSGMSF